MGQKSTSSYCRLFLATPTCFNIEDMVVMLEIALATGDVASLLIGHEDIEQLEKAAKVLTPIAQSKDVAVLIEGAVNIAVMVDADGVLVAGETKDYDQARTALGDDKIVGVDCSVDRHGAMALGEAGADFVMFDDAAIVDDGKLDDVKTQLSSRYVNEPIGNWWARVFEVPCVIMGPKSLESAKASFASGVEFLCPPSAMWEDAMTVAKTVGSYNQLIKDTPVDEASF